MNDFFQTSMFAGVALSIISYLIGVALKKKFKSPNILYEVSYGNSISNFLEMKAP